MGVAEQNRNHLPERRQNLKVGAARSGTPIVATLLPDCDIAQAMGARDWWRLPPAIRNRFERLSVKQSETLYRGVMSIVSCNLAGKLLAQLSRLIGTPLAPYRGRDIATEVAVYPAPKKNGKVWERCYAFPGRVPLSVKSTKILDTNAQLLEVVGANFGMELRVFEEHRALQFVSKRYFWEGFGHRFYLPDLLTPGQAHVSHTDLGDGAFRFQISIMHPLLGETFFQVGDFREVTERGDPAK